MIYLASPYTHHSTAVRQERYEAARAIVAHMLPRYPLQPIFSPIVYAHEMALHHGMKHDAATWRSFNMGMLRIASELWVLPLDGWKESKGVQDEIMIANLINLPRQFINESGEFVL